MSVWAYRHGDAKLLKDPLDLSDDDLSLCDVKLAALGDDVGHWARSLVHENRLIACFGIWPLGNARGAAWSILTEESVAHPKMLFAAVRGQLVEFEESEGLRRIEALGRVDNPRLDSWFRHLGFERETKDTGMRGYGPGGEDMHLYARVRE